MKRFGEREMSLKSIEMIKNRTYECKWMGAKIGHLVRDSNDGKLYSLRFQSMEIASFHIGELDGHLLLEERVLLGEYHLHSDGEYRTTVFGVNDKNERRLAEERIYDRALECCAALAAHGKLSDFLDDTERS